MPPPVVAPPATAFDEVTNGYEPWSRSRSVPWAPSSRTCSPRASADWTSHVVSSRCVARAARPSRPPARRAPRRRTASAPIEPSSRFLSGSSRSRRVRRTLAVEQVLHPQPDAPRPIAVRRPDPPPRRADLGAVEAGLVRPVQGHVVRHDHVGRAADPDPATRRCPRDDEHVQLADERLRVDDDAVPDHRGDVRVQHARRHEVELQDLVALDHRVAGVVAALVAHDHRDLLGQEVGRLALALVAPLEPHDDRGGHQRALRPRRAPRIEKAPGLVARVLWLQISRGSPPECGDWSAGRSAASRDGRRALIARSHDLPCPSRLDAARERPEYSRASRACEPPPDPDAAHSLLPRRPDGAHTSLAPCTRKTWTGPAEPPPTGTAAVARRSVRIQRNDRPPLSREAIDGWRRRAISPAGRVPARGRSLMVARLVTLDRDLPLPTLRPLRRPFDGPWPTPRVAPGAPRLGV